MKKWAIVILLFSSVAYAASPFIFGPDGPISLQPLSGLLRATPGNVVKGGVTLLPPLAYNNSTGVISLTPGPAGTFAGYDALGVLSYIPGWTFDPTYGGVNMYTPRDITSSGSFNYINLEMPSVQTADTAISLTALGIDSYLDRANTGTNFSGNFNGMVLSARGEGSGHVQNIQGAQINAQSGNGNGGSSDNLAGMNLGAFVAAGSSVTNVQGMSVNIDSTGSTMNNATTLSVYSSGTEITNLQSISIGNNASISQGYTGINLNNGGTVGLDFYPLNINNSAPIGRNTNMLSISNQSTGTVAGDFRGINMGNDAAVAGNYSGYSINTTAPVAKSYSAFSALMNKNMGDGTSNSQGVSIQFSGGTMFGGLTGFQFNNDDHIDGNFNINGLDINNGSNGTGYSYTGMSLNQQANFTESILGTNINSTGNARTQTGERISLTGNATDDARGLQVQVDNLTTSSTTQHIHSGEFSGGTFSVQSNYSPFSGVGFEIGNNITATATVNSGSPLTGSDQILQLLQANLLVNDDISTGPFGVDTNMIGIVSQLAVDTGKTVPLLRSEILGTSVPMGGGGTVTRHEVLTLLGLPSFGGTVTNPTRIGINFAGIFGQDFCGGANPATDCWGIYNPDASARNWFKGGIVTGGSTGIPTGAYELDVGADAVFGGYIYSNTGNQSIDTNGLTLIKNGYSILDWNTQKLSDDAGNESIEFKNRNFKDSGGNVNLNYSAHIQAKTKLEVNNGHIQSTQTTAPAANVNANAGAGATCALTSATDTAGIIQLTTTLVANSSGSQCDIAFNSAYSTSPVCVFSPVESNAATSDVILGAYVSTSTSQLSIAFTNADLVGQTYSWSYNCLETQ